MSAPPRLSTTEYVVLGILAEAPNHGFAISKQLAAEAELGRVFTVRRPLVYRALDRLAATGYVESVSTEPGRAGPNRVIQRVTRTGKRRLKRWMAEPVEHVRDLRIEFLVKLTLHERAGTSPTELIRNQRAALEPTIAALDGPSGEATDPVELWRRHNAAAAAAFLTELGTLYPQPT